LFQVLHFRSRTPSPILRRSKKEQQKQQARPKQPERSQIQQNHQLPTTKIQQQEQQQGQHEHQEEYLHQHQHQQNQQVAWHTDKKENKIFLIYKEIQKGAVAKSYMTNGLLIYMTKYIGSPSSYMTLQLLPSEFPYILKNVFSFFISARFLTCQM
jgi:hypothetical protein